MPEKRVKLKFKQGIISCQCNDGQILLDIVGLKGADWQGECQTCYRLKKCVDAIRDLRNNVMDQNQK